MKRNLFLNSLKRLFFLWLFTCFGAVAAFSQNKPVTGKIFDSQSNETIIGATIRIKGTATGVATDVNGAFKIEAPAGAVLQINSVGYTPVEIAADFSKPMLVSLKISSNQLNEVIVQAFQSTTKLKVVNAII
jgi:hypothetical protein